MKKLWFFLAMFVCVLASCSDGGNDDPNPTPRPEEVKTEITIDSGIVTNGLSFSTAGGDQSVSFSVNANWTLSVASTTRGSTWCTASATSGSKGTANVKFTVTENTDYDDRSVSVTIKAGTVSKTFTITQKGTDALLVTTSKYEVAQEGGQIEIEVKANINYQMEISETSKDWITESKSKSRGLTTYKHKLDIAMNEETEKREGEITFKSGDKVETVKVYQAGGAILLLSQNEYTVSDAGDTISVDIKSNVEFGVQMPDVDWIVDEASSRGMSSHTLKYVVMQNKTRTGRSASLIFYDRNGELKDTITINQQGKTFESDEKDEVNNDKENNSKSEMAIDMGLSVKWASCNLGAKVPEGYGDYFAFGTVAPMSEESENWNNPNTLKLSGDYDAATYLLGSGWRMPTKTECEELLKRCIWKLIDRENVKGYEVTGENGNSIFLPLTGRYGSTEGHNYEARYRTSEAESDGEGYDDLSTIVMELQKNISDTEMDYVGGSGGHPIRPVLMNIVGKWEDLCEPACYYVFEANGAGKCYDGYEVNIIKWKASENNIFIIKTTSTGKEKEEELNIKWIDIDKIEITKIQTGYNGSTTYYRVKE